MTSPSEAELTKRVRPRPHLTLRARHGESEIAFEAKDKFAIGAVVLLLVAIAIVFRMVS